MTVTDVRVADVGKKSRLRRLAQDRAGRLSGGNLMITAAVLAGILASTALAATPTVTTTATDLDFTAYDLLVNDNGAYPAGAVRATGNPMNDFPITVMAPDSADLALSKNGPSSVLTGDPISYTLVVANQGPDTATNVRVDDALPDGVVFESASSGCNENSAIVTCTAGTLANGESVTWDINVTAPAQVGSLTNKAAVSSDTLDPNEGNDLATAATSVIPPTADLAISKTGPSTVTQGDPISYALVVVNHGPDTATNIMVEDALPGGVTFGSASSGCSENSAIVTCTAGTLANGESVTWEITVTAPAQVGPLTNTAAVSSDTPDPNEANNEATATTNVISPTADLVLSKNGPSSVLTGDPISYTLVVANHGPSAATNVTMDDALPGGVTYESASSGCAENNAIVTCTVDTLANGESVTWDINVTAPAQEGPLTNTATVSSDTPDPNETNNQASATTAVSKAAPVTPPDLAITPHPAAGTTDKVQRGATDVVALGLTATSGTTEAVAISGLRVEVDSVAVANGIARVALHSDADGDGNLDPGSTPLASGAFAPGSTTAALALGEGATVAAGGSAHYLLVVDLDGAVGGSALGPRGAAPATGWLGLAGLLISPLLFVRRRKSRLVLLVLACLSLVACRTAVPPTASFQLTLEKVAAQGEDSGLAATVTGLPMSGVLIEVSK